MQIGYYVSYVLLFVVGCVAWRHRWLERVDAARALRWGITALVVVPLLPIAILAFHAQWHYAFGASGGWNPDALVYALWEPFVAWGVILALLWTFRVKVRPDRLRGLARRAYAIYCIHPPVVVGISVALRGWGAPPAFKFLAVGSLSCVALYVLCGLLLRVPGVARVL